MSFLPLAKLIEAVVIGAAVEFALHSLNNECSDVKANGFGAPEALLFTKLDHAPSYTALGSTIRVSVMP